jgi:hypothetical protein
MPRISITDAALQLGKSYHQVLNLVLRGTLKGGRARGHYYVDVQALEAFKRAQASARRKRHAS